MRRHVGRVKSSVGVSPGIIFFSTSKNRRPFLARSTPTTGRRGFVINVQWLNTKSRTPHTTTIK